MEKTKTYIVNCKTCGREITADNRARRNCYRCNNPDKKFYPLKWQRIRKAVMERDNYECQTCGTTKNLHIHHKDGNIDNNLMKNLVTRCYQCHPSQHHVMRKVIGIRRGEFGNRIIYQEVSPVITFLSRIGRALIG